ncbi:MAG: tRNA (adenosine(37)-N6)-dimethylallyltransferase MiaA [Planctomycetota bacterium]
MSKSLTDENQTREVRRILTGPTASGKSAVAAQMYQLLAGAARPLSLISMDSMLVYRRLNVVTAKPTPAELLQTPLACVDLTDPSESFSVAKYLAAAEEAERRAFENAHTAVFVGGTGLYLKSLTRGLFDGPAADPALRESLSARAAGEGAESLHFELLQNDPQAAAKIHPRDRKRIIRALEVFHSTGRTISSYQKQWNAEPFVASKIVSLRIEKPELNKRIEARVDWMLQNGLLTEIESVRAGGLSKEARAAVGVREVIELLDGKISLEECRIVMIRRTKELARRQATWFRSFPEMVWIDAGANRSVSDIARDVIRALDITC